MGTLLQFMTRRKPRPEGNWALRPVAVADAADVLLMQAAKRELHDIAVLTIMTCGTINYFDRLADWHLERSALRNIPPDPIVLPVALAHLCERGACPEARTLFGALVTYIRNAKRLLEASVADTAGAPSAAERDELTAVWGEVAGILLLCLYEIDRVAEANCSSIDPFFNDVCASLIAVRDGGVVYGDTSDGSRPAWAQRRFRRVRLGMDAIVSCRGQRINARATDISQGGMGLEFASALTVGEEVLVELASGRRFGGRIAWCNAGRAGIAFATHLASNDPLISAG